MCFILAWIVMWSHNISTLGHVLQLLNFTTIDRVSKIYSIYCIKGTNKLNCKHDLFG